MTTMRRLVPVPLSRLLLVLSVVLSRPDRQKYYYSQSHVRNFPYNSPPNDDGVHIVRFLLILFLVCGGVVHSSSLISNNDKNEEASPHDLVPLPLTF